MCQISSYPLIMIAHAIIALSASPLSATQTTPTATPSPRPLARSAESIDIATDSPLAITGSGIIVALEHDRNSLMTMNKNGSLIRRIGRSGQGPFEFQYIQSVASIGDTIIVLDAGSRRLSMLAANGTGVRTIKIDDGAELLEMFPQGDGSFLIYANAPVASGTFKKVTPGQVAKQPVKTLLRVQRNGITTRIGMPADTQSVMRGNNCESKTGVIYDIPNAYAPEGPMIAVTPSGQMARAERWAPVIDWYRVGASGGLRRSTLNEKPKPITDSLWSTMLAPWRQRERQAGALVCNTKQIRRPFMPMIRALVVDDSDRVWAVANTARGTVLATVAAGQRADVVAVLPDRIAPTRFAVSGSLMAVLRSDRDDVPYVQILALPR